MLLTPELVKYLRPNQVVLAGTNREGRHGLGFALTCVKRFGAIYGQAEGLQGQTYGIITKELRKNKPKVELPEVEDGIVKFFAFAEQHPQLEFLVTKIGVGLAGFPLTDIANLFSKHYNSLLHYNVIFPLDFVAYIPSYTKS